MTQPEPVQMRTSVWGCSGASTVPPVAAAIFDCGLPVSARALTARAPA